MANTHTAEVVRFIRQKSENGFDAPITYLGAEQRFVGALRNSNINNLEEQYILGTDTITETYTDEDGNTIIEKSYHTISGGRTNYYKVKTIIYKDGVVNQDFFFDEDILKLPNDPNENVFGDGSEDFPNINEIYFVNADTFRLKEDGNIDIYPSTFTTIREDKLYYITNNGQDELLVLTKTTGRKYLDDGAREVIRESIENHLIEP